MLCVVASRSGSTGRSRDGCSLGHPSALISEVFVIHWRNILQALAAHSLKAKQNTPISKHCTTAQQ